MDTGSGEVGYTPTIDIELDVEPVTTAFGEIGESIDASNDEIGVQPAKRPANLIARRHLRYLIAAIAGMLLVWAPAVLVFKFAPDTYKSRWTIMIPGTTQGATVDIDNLGQANTSIDSPYGGKSIDPKVNYKAIALSETVLTAAAQRSDGMTRNEYGKPKINLVDQTTMIEVVTSASSAELAHLKSRSLYDALQDELNRLRKNERVNIERGNQQQLAEYRQTVQRTQAALREYQREADIVTAVQYDRLIDRLEEVSSSRSDAQLQQGALAARLQAMQTALGMSAIRAADILKLRQDLMFHSQLEVYAAAHAASVETESVLGAKHPKVVHARARSAEAYGSLKYRADDVLGYSSDDILQQYLPNSNADDASLYQSLILAQADLQAVNAQVEKFDVLLPELKSRVRGFGEDAARLEQLKRDHQIANTILVSATTKLDLGKADIFASYPMTQLLVEPTVPEKPQRLQKLFVLLGAAVASILLLLALVVFWYRKVWLRKTLKSA